ncbi:MAG: FHA domain-containing protein [Myxococcota bacterium]
MAPQVTETLPALEEGSREQLVPYFEVVSDSQRGRRFHLVRHSGVIGRDSDVDFVLDARGVSRKHARLMREATGSVQLIDLGAKNGTLLNGRKIEMTVLRAGDRIRIGTAELLFGFEDLLEAASDEVASSAQHDTRLRKREREVADLVAEGLTNAAIAQRLHISPRTVSTHMTKIYERLGLHSRAALTRWVVQQRSA